MGEPALKFVFPEEPALAERAAELARAWARAQRRPLIIGLAGELGSGKSTWARAMLRGLGYAGRVPSPTYTLLEQYRVGTLEIAHLDLYRLNDPLELEDLAIRDWLARDDAWLLVEWPERAPALARQCDLGIRFEIVVEGGRQVLIEARTEAGRLALERYVQSDSNYSA